MFELNKNLSRASLEIKRIYETNLNGRIIQPFQSKEIKEEVRNILKEVIVFHDAKFNYTVIKWFNDEEIKYMQDLTKEKYNSFNVQPHEHYSHQIKELRINAFDKPLHQLICTKFFLDMEWILAQIYDIFIEDFDSIHFTRYRVNEIKSNAWHYDNNSNLTCITTLNSDYTGGELSLTNSGVYGDINVFDYKKYPVGHTHIFNGKKIHHGNDILSGEKNLMVIWASQKKLNNEILTAKQQINALRKYNHV